VSIVKLFQFRPQVQQTILLQLAAKVYGSTEFRLDGMRILVRLGYQDSVSDLSDGFPHTSNCDVQTATFHASRAISLLLTAIHHLKNKQKMLIVSSSGKRS
jgi:hypothetical protein